MCSAALSRFCGALAHALAVSNSHNVQARRSSRSGAPAAPGQSAVPILSMQSGCSGSGSRPSTSPGASPGQGDEWHGDLALSRAELYLIQDPFATDLGCGGNLAGRKLEVCCLSLPNLKS